MGNQEQKKDAGTAIGIRFKTDAQIDFELVRKMIVASGETKAKQIQGAIEKASRSSGGRYYLV